ncbi:hypothetical protein [Clostridium paraputrificum]|uniref:hypothetical protein n=1 Tax=Clostridium paraputrificum TaxID=29363 RepID=UPI00374F2DE0
MSKKVTACILIGVLTTTFGVQPIKAKALQNDSVRQEEVQDIKIIEPEEGKEYDLNKVIKIIESKYLEQKEDGTLLIKSTASDEIDKDVLELMYEQIDFVNQKIRTGELEFKLTNTENGVKVETIKEAVIDKQTKTIGTNIFNYDFCEFSWYWWGFYANVDQTGSQKLANEYTYLAAAYGAGFGLLALIPGGAIPGAVGVAVTAISVGDCIRVCANGAVDNGVLVGALGAPSNPKIFHLSEM